MTRGRTPASDGTAVGLIDVVAATGRRPPDGVRLSPEQRDILRLGRRPATVVDLAAILDLPAGVVRVLIGDLSEHGLLRVHRARRERLTDEGILREVISGLRAL